MGTTPQAPDSPTARAADLRQRLDRHDLNHRQAARLLKVNPSTIWRWATEDVTITDRAYDHIVSKLPL